MRPLPSPSQEPHLVRTEPDRREAQLRSALQSGDPRIAAELYGHLRPSIDHALRRVLHHRYRDFDDLVQQTFERILRALAENRFEGRSSLRTWASAIATHVALDALRSGSREARRFVPLEDLPPHTARPRADASVEVQIELRRIQSILSRMKPDLAETLVLFEVLGYPVEEIADLRGASVSATQARLHRARLELKRRSERPLGAGSLVHRLARVRGPKREGAKASRDSGAEAGEES